MGKRSKQGASLRAAKRAKVANQQLEHALSEQSEQHRVQSRGDEELFVIDTDRKETTASSRAIGARRKAEKEASKKGKHEYSVFEKRQIQKVVKTHGIEGTIALAEMGRARLQEKRTQKHTAAAAVKPTFDIWDEPTPVSTAYTGAIVEHGPKLFAAVARPIEMPKPKQMVVAKLSNKQLKARVQALESAPPTLAVEVAHPGQSYHPDKEHHQDAIGEALSIEIRRNEAAEYKSKPISEGMSAFTKEFIVDSDEEEEESSDEEDEVAGDGNYGTTIVKKRKEKLTRAQRNKQKRAKAELTAIKERKQHKQFMHQANEVRRHDKAVKQAEAEQRERQEVISTLKMEKKSKPLGKDVWGTLSQKDPIRAPSFPVALTDELQKNGGGAAGGGGGGGLRTVTPKGSLVTDRLESMVARNMISKKKMEGRRIVQGKRRPKTRGPEGAEYLLT